MRTLLYTVIILFTASFGWGRELSSYNAFLAQEGRTPGVSLQQFDASVYVDRIEVEPRLGIPTVVWIKINSKNTQNSTGDPIRIAQEVLGQYSDLYRYTKETLGTANLQFVHDKGKAVVVKFKQTIHGIDVYGAQTNVLLDQSRRVVGITGYLFPYEIPNKLIFDQGEKLAIVSSLNDFEGVQFEASDFALTESKNGYNYYRFSGNYARVFVRPIRMKAVLFPLNERFVPAYYLELNTGEPNKTDSDFFAYIVSAETGEVLMRQNLTSQDSFTYKVWAKNSGGPPVFQDGPQGNAASPHPTGTPDGYQEPFVAPSSLTIESIAPVTDPWLPSGATETVGNNVDAYIDRFGTDGYQPVAGDFRASETSTGVFDYTFDHGSDPQTSTDSQKAALVQMFYVSNYLHDVYYEAGFDEVAGNAQADNFGRGGVDGDVMHCEGQDGGGTNNANMSTPADGGSPRMQMYIFPGPDPDRDGTIDNGISSHEWGHYLHARLIPFIGTQQSGGMGEGWGDFVALLETVEDGDAYDGAYTTGAYATYHLGGTTFENNFYFGIRRFPYSTDFTKNGLTFKNIGGPTSNLPANPISELGFQYNGNEEVHNAGEIWCTMLWEAYHDLIEARTLLGDSFVQIQKDMRAYVVLSMKLSPSYTTFTEAADAMLLAVKSTNTADFQIFADAFARRGIGKGAVSPARNSNDNSGVVESFIPNSLFLLESAVLDDSVESCDSDGILDPGEKGLLTVVLRNDSYGNMLNTTGTVTSPQNVQFQNGGTLVFPASAAGETMEATIEVNLAFGESTGAIQFNFTFDDTDPAISSGNDSVTMDCNFDEFAHSTDTDDVESSDNVWVRTSAAGNELWRRVEDGVFNSGSHSWFVPDTDFKLDSFLTTPVFTVNSVGDFIFSFYHAFSFESGSWDGGVLELSTDGGTNWVDIGSYADSSYNGTIKDNPESSISNRPAYVNESWGFPTLNKVTVNLGTQYAGQDVQVRFRIGCDGLAGAVGWYLDDIQFPTLDTPLFTTRVAEPDRCLTCFYTEEDAADAIRFAVGQGEWPNPYSILDYMTTYLQFLCP